MTIELDGVNNTLKTDKIEPQSGTALQVGASGDVRVKPIFGCVRFSKIRQGEAVDCKGRGSGRDQTIAQGGFSGYTC